MTTESQLAIAVDDLVRAARRAIQGGEYCPDCYGTGTAQSDCRCIYGCKACSGTGSYGVTCDMCDGSGWLTQCAVDGCEEVARWPYNAPSRCDDHCDWEDRSRHDAKRHVRGWR